MPGIQKISIDQQLAEIGVRNTPAMMRIQQQRPEMSIKTESPHMEIERKNPTFKVNRKKINNESGLKGSPELSKEYRDKGRVGALRGSKNSVHDGNFLGETRKPGDRVSKLAHSKAMNNIAKKQNFNIGLMPKSSPDIIWDKGSMRINWSKHSIVIDWDGEYMPQVTIDPKSSIEIFLRTEPHFRIMVEDGVDPNMPGRLIDKAI